MELIYLSKCVHMQCVKMWHCTNVTLRLCVWAHLWTTVTVPNQTACTPRSRRGCGKAVLSKIVLSILSVYYMTNLQCRVSERTPPPRFWLCILFARITWLACVRGPKKPKGHLWNSNKIGYSNMNFFFNYLYFFNVEVLSEMLFIQKLILKMLLTIKQYTLKKIKHRNWK